MSARSSASLSCTQFLTNLILPPRCFGCGEITLEQDTLCSGCWKACSFLSPPWCNLCGWPFPYDAPDQSLCPHCHRQPPLFIECRSALAYQDASRSFILKLKHGDATYLAPALSKLMARVGTGILSKTDLLIPVPLHWKRLFWRQYNQATLLSNHLSLLTAIPTYPNLLIRHRSTPKQGHLNRKDRYANVRGAFAIPKEKAYIIKGKSLTLIDDVFTTGATLTECARVLLKAGAKEVRVITLARVITALK